jgi:hypothetical protein
MDNLKEEIKASKIFKIYNFLVNFYYKHKKWYMWVLLAVFLIGFFDFIIHSQNATIYSTTLLLTSWIPAILFLLIIAPIHFIVGFKLRNLSKKYKISFSELLKIIGEEKV